MLLDLGEIAQDATLDADVCIVGAGAAGITLARSLLSTSLNVCVLESGGFDHEPRIADLGVGENRAMSYYDLVDSRLRFFGGTTNIWGGRCVPLDPEDFEAKPWVPHSGWPIGIEDLQDGYARAHRDLEIGEPITGRDAWQRLGTCLPEYLRSRFTSGFWYFDDEAERFNASRCQDLFSAPNVRIVTHASVTHLQAGSQAHNLTHIEFGGLGGKRARVRARAYVLAAGAIENARLMLMSRDVEAAGVGNRHDQVGRYFMEHPHGRLGEVDSAKAFQLWAAFEKRFPPGSVPLAPVLRPSQELQAREGILNTALTFKLQRDPDRGLAINRRAYQSLKHQLNPNRYNRALWHGYNGLKREFQRRRTPLVQFASQLQSHGVHAIIRGEQAPNPESRVMLSDSVDALGQPRADLHWHLSNQDKHTLRVLADQLVESFRDAAIGTFVREPWVDEPDPAWPVDPTVGNHPIGGYHHMGTTRMSHSDRSGVTDRNCQVFGYSNLFLAGSSVFATSGWANPTLTILALTYRLSDHLQATLASNDPAARAQPMAAAAQSQPAVSIK